MKTKDQGDFEKCGRRQWYVKRLPREQENKETSILNHPKLFYYSGNDANAEDIKHGYWSMRWCRASIDSNKSPQYIRVNR